MWNYAGGPVAPVVGTIGNGWTLIQPFFAPNNGPVGAGGITLCLVKNTLGTALPYFICRLQQGGFPGVGYPTCVRGVTATFSILTLLGTGSLPPGKVIGYNQTAYDPQNVNLPFPTTAPPLSTNIGNAIQVGDYIIAVVGMDPAFWIAHAGGGRGAVFGTNTWVTS